MNQSIIVGFLWILLASVAGGAFGLQYRVMRKYSVDNTSLLSMFFATIVVPLIAVNFLLPGWTRAIAEVGLARNALVFLFGFGWGMGAITYAFGFNFLGMALAAAMIKGISVAIGSGVPLLRHWSEVSPAAKGTTLVGILFLLLGTAIAGRAGILREREVGDVSHDHVSGKAANARRIFILGFICCLLSGVLSACANLGYEFAGPLESAMGEGLNWRATLIRWMPMYWGGIAALLLFMGGSMVRNGTWRNYLSPGSGRDFVVASLMGGVHFLAQIPYGIGAFYLGMLGTTVGWGMNIGMALVVAAALGFLTGEWRQASRRAVQTLLVGMGVLIFAMAILAYANGLQ